MRHAILTHDLRVLTVAQETILLRPLGVDLDPACAVLAARSGDGVSLRTQGGAWYDFATGRFTREVPGGFVDLLPGLSGIGHVIRHGGSFLRADPLHFVDFIGRTPDWWETFRLVPLFMLPRLQAMLAGDWSVNGDAQTERFDLTRGDLRAVALGAHRVEFEAMLATLETSEALPGSFLFQAGGLVNRAMRFRPAFVFTLFGHGPETAGLGMAIDSLVHDAAYGGEIVLVSDLPEDYLRARVGPEAAARVRIIPMGPNDRLDLAGAALAVFGTDLLDAYQPIASADVGTLFMAPVDAPLRAALWAPRCSLWSGGDSPVDPGVIVVPGMDEYRAVLRGAHDALVRVAAERGFLAAQGAARQMLAASLQRVKRLETVEGAACRSFRAHGDWTAVMRAAAGVTED